MNFWEVVDLEREYKNISRKELAYLANFSVNSIPTGITRGSIPAADVAYRIAKVLGVSVEYLLTSGEKETISNFQEVQNSQIDTEIIERSKKYTKNYELIENFDKLPEEIKKTLNKLIEEISMQKCVD
ncbi:MAG: helix-turn-helix domain-containing protein [Spirochaetaceae bacterium]|nr:helix-turn-helix domain-containing protein [Spirochaetaceae bacterium]